jgi:hypothetical protein
MHAVQTTVATTLGSMPSALAFAQDMFLNVPLIADWQAIAHTCEHHVNENLRRAKREQLQYDHAPGLQVLKKVHNPTKLGVITEGPYTIELGLQVLKKVHIPTKLGVRTEGPYTIERIHVNGNLPILLSEGITERINICSALLYH